MMLLSVKKLQTIKQNIINDIVVVFKYYSNEYKTADKNAKEKKDNPTDHNYWEGYRDGVIAATTILLKKIKQVKDEYGISEKE